EKVAPFHFKKTISDHSSITVLGIAVDGQKNGIPIGGAPAPKRTFKKMLFSRQAGIIWAFA
ncbi:hypothetical protein, partial [Escherichia coli]|uniref:hypothetical protein n=1 Tax=Escherichia coli TaxID=562 RepID=UPI00193CB894